MAIHDSTIEIEVAYALPNQQILKKISVQTDTTVQQAIEYSGIMQEFPEIDLAKNKLGIFSKFVQLNTPLKSRDRIEIYRPLIIDPKEARRLRVKKK